MKFLPEQMYQLTGRNCISNFQCLMKARMANLANLTQADNR